MKTTVIERLTENLKSFPDKIIVLDHHRSWTWQQLFLRASDYALMIEKSSLQHRVMPFIADRTGESLAAMIGCIMCGVGFAPLSGSQPRERLISCLKSLGSDILLHTSPVENTLESSGLSEEHPPLNSTAIRPFKESHFVENKVIYTLFTSGSTGIPKGVLVTANNIENTMRWSEEILDWNTADIMGGATNFFFDISIFDVFNMMYFNVPLALYSDMRDSLKVAKETLQFKITSIFSVPLFFSQLIKTQTHNQQAFFPDLRRIISGGDFFPPEHIIQWMKNSPNTKIYNVWGPTETSIVNTMHLISEIDLNRLRDGKSPPVGKSHPRMEYVIVSEDRKEIIEVPNQIGEIVMLGDCVSAGYLNSPELASASFSTIRGKRCFYTQDLGYNDESHNLYISGRIGSTVKVAGFRVDLGEIDSKAVNYPNVHLACSYLKKIENQISELQIAIELNNNQVELDIFEFKTFLRASLPYYMVPKKIVILNKIPLNLNGKIDRKKVQEGILE